MHEKFKRSRRAPIYKVVPGADDLVNDEILLEQSRCVYSRDGWVYQGKYNGIKEHS